MAAFFWRRKKSVTRKPYEESCSVLVTRGLLDTVPPLPPRMPAHDDEVLGVSFFRTQVCDEDLSGLSLPRTFFGRSEIARCSFEGSDLSEARANWNDFEQVDFSRANLTGADLRASRFVRCHFDGANLAGADLRHSTFEGCSFRDARLSKTRVTEEQIPMLPRAEREGMSIEEPGQEPEGG